MILDLGQSQASFEWIRVTAEYSNAVLVAVMPYISDIAQKLDLPVARPVAIENVVHCSVMPRRAIGVEIGLREGWVFAFDRSYVQIIQGPRSFLLLQDPDRIPEFFGEVRMSEREAVQMARDALTKLGISLESVFAEQEPHVGMPRKYGTNVVPYYYVSWPDPRGNLPVDIEVNASLKRIERIGLPINKSLERPPPKLSVTASTAPNNPQWPKINPEYAQKLIPIILQAVDDYGKKLGLAIPRPLTTNHVAQLSIADNGGWPHCELGLTNGWHFIYRNSMVNGYYAPDDLFSIYGERRPVLIKNILGHWNMTEAEAMELIRKNIAKLGYSTNLTRMDFAPQVHTSTFTNIPRYSFWWWCENEAHDDLVSKVEAEVDADKRELKSLYFDHISFWNKPPPIDVPITLPTASANSAASATNQPASKPTKSAKPPTRPFAPYDAKPKK